MWRRVSPRAALREVLCECRVLLLLFVDPGSRVVVTARAQLRMEWRVCARCAPSSGVNAMRLMEATCGSDLVRLME